MRKLLKMAGYLLFFSCILFFVYGSMKTVEASDTDPIEIDLGEGLTMTKESQADYFAGKAFTISGISLVGGVLALVFARGMKK